MTDEAQKDTRRWARVFLHRSDKDALPAEGVLSYSWLSSSSTRFPWSLSMGKSCS